MSVNDFTKYLTARVIENKTIVLEVISTDYSLRFLGSTMQANVDVIKSGKPDVTQIVLYPEKGEDGLIALCVRIKRRNMDDFVSAFFSVTWKEKDGEKFPFICLDKSWVAPERIGHVTSFSIEIEIENMSFSSFNGEVASDSTYVPDANLLCRYLWGTASALEVVYTGMNYVSRLIIERSNELETGFIRNSPNETTEVNP